jgi:4a-hydroxytetrahydrobiopterin dehydratase
MGVPPLKGEKLKTFLDELDNNWTVIEEHHLEKEYSFADFREGLDFTVKIGELAERQGHHPDIYLSWGKVKLTVWTHKIDGLTESDFIFAAKADHEL